MKISEDILVCECSSNEHQIIIRDFDEDDDGYVYVSIHLNRSRNFWQRVILAIKYVFGYKCKYGAWDEFMLSKKHIDKLEKITNYLKK